MNLEQYQAAQIVDPHFDENHVFFVELDDLIVADHEISNEVRCNGLNTTGFEQLKHEIRTTKGNIVPIDVCPEPGEKYRPGDGGGHRYKAHRQLWDETGEECFKRMKAVERTYSSRQERTTAMLNANLPAYTQNHATDDDIVSTFHKLITEDYCWGTNYSKKTIDDIKELIRTSIQKSFHGNKLNSLARKVYNLLPHTSSKYTAPVDDTEIVDFFNKNNPYGVFLPPSGYTKGGRKYNWGPVVKDTDGQEWAIYCGKQETWTTQNIIHYAFHKKGAFPGVKILVIGYNGSIKTTKKNECPIANFRKSAHANFEKLTPDNTKLLTMRLIDRDIYLPQITKGKNKENMNCFYNHQGKPIIVATK